MIGNYTHNHYTDTIKEGIALIKKAAASLAKDPKNEATTTAILHLLSQNKKGNLRLSKVAELKEIAEDLKNKRMLEGVRLIEESCRITESKLFIKAEYKTPEGTWNRFNLGITNDWNLF